MNKNLKMALLAVSLTVLIAGASLATGWALNNYFWTHTTNWSTNVVFGVSQNDTVIPSGISDRINITGTSISEEYMLSNNGTLPLNVNATVTTTSGNVSWIFTNDPALPVTFPFALTAGEFLALTLNITNVLPSGSFTVSFSASDNSVS
jgi:hypothetical protein